MFEENYTSNPPQDEGFSQPAHSLVLLAALGKFEASARGDFDEANIQQLNLALYVDDQNSQIHLR